MRVERIEIVSAFTRDEAVLLKHGPQINALAQRLRGTVSTLNAPDRSPPELPRLVVRFEDSLLQVGFNRYQIVMEPPKHVSGSYDDAIEYARNRVRPILKDLTNSGAYEWTGIVVECVFPQDLSRFRSGNQAVHPVFSRLTTLDWPEDELASFDLRLGLRRNGYFRSYVISGYEIRELQFMTPPGVTRVAIDTTQGRVTETGYSIVLDVNNRPLQSKAGPITDLEAGLREHAAAYSSLSDDLNLRGLL